MKFNILLPFKIFVLALFGLNMSACEKGEQIAFISVRDESAEVYIVNIDGTGLRRITNSRYGEAYPAWLPDGSGISFIYGRHVDGEVYMSDGGGKEPIRLTSETKAFGNLSWSPDGKMLAYTSASINDPDQYQINVYAVNGTELNPALSVPSIAISWSPDGQHITYAAGNIFVLNLATQVTKRITDLPIRNYNCHSAIWSPNGNQIAFVYSRDIDMVGSRAEIYVVNADGSDLRLITNQADEFYPVAWAPDGTKIAFLYRRNIYTMNPDGSNRTQLTFGGEDSEPTWSPDSGKIAFTSHRNGNWDIFVVNLDGSGLYQLTDNENDDYDIAWRP